MSINLGPGITVRIKVEGAGLPSGGEDGKILGHENGRPQWVEDKQTGIGSVLGNEYAGMLLYINEEGKVAALKLGEGLRIDDGMLVLDQGIAFEPNDDGTVRISGVEFQMLDDGSVLLNRAEFEVQDDGSIMLQ